MIKRILCLCSVVLCDCVMFHLCCSLTIVFSMLSSLLQVRLRTCCGFSCFSVMVEMSLLSGHSRTSMV